MRLYKTCQDIATIGQIRQLFTHRVGDCTVSRGIANTWISNSSLFTDIDTSGPPSMEHSSQRTRYAHHQAAYPSSRSCASTHSRTHDSSPPRAETQQPPYSSPATSHSSATIDSALSQSTLDTSTYAPSKGSKRDQSAYQSQTSFSPLLARAQTGTLAPGSSSSSSKTKFLKAIFDRKRKDGKQASQDALKTTTSSSSSQAASSGAQTRPSVPSSSSQKRNGTIQPQRPQISFADLAYRYGSPSSKPPRL